MTVMGLTLANQRSVVVHHIIEFKETLSVLLISSLFIILAARLHLSAVAAVGWRGLLLLAALIIVARPVCVAVSTIGPACPGGSGSFWPPWDRAASWPPRLLPFSPCVCTRPVFPAPNFSCRLLSW